MEIKIAVLILIALMLLTGCSTPITSPTATIDPALVQRAEAVARGWRDAHFTLDVELRHPLLSDTLAIESWYVRPDRLRLEVLESTHLNFKGVMSASRGESGWTYNPMGQRVDVGPTSAIKPAVLYDMVLSTVRLFFAEDVGKVDTVSADHVNENVAFRLGLSRESGTCSLWVRQDSLLPLKARCDSKSLGRYTVTVREAEHNLGLTDDLFEVDFLPGGPVVLHGARRSDPIVVSFRSISCQAAS